MIQASELRIGNYIYNEVQEINFKACSVVIHRLSHGDSEGYKPIELTEEILLKCGFEYSKALSLYRLKESNVIYEYCEEEDECNYFIHFYHDGTNLIVESSNEHGEMANMKFNHIKYFHQLQNLYFALTGQELEINF